MSQSASRIPGRGGEPAPARRGGFGGRPSPDSFGRAKPEETPEPPAASPVTAVDGKVRIAVDADLVLGDDAAQAFYDQIRELTQLAISDGYAAVFGAPPAPPAQETGDPGHVEAAAAP